ncbi:unnamed protein product [Meloidogyne enterolobii]|uniref:Uncharacterized protein n=1 Tax=Meloidogyne enterolobii TaxID=390850 RepID=A0ACB0XRC4_MELEN
MLAETRVLTPKLFFFIFVLSAIFIRKYFLKILFLKFKWCSWVALFCSCVSFANVRASDDTKQIVSSFMLSISAVVMSYLQNPAPIVPPWV